MKFSSDSTALMFCRFVKRCDEPGKYHPYWQKVKILKGARKWIPIHAAVKLIKDKYVKRVK